MNTLFIYNKKIAKCKCLNLRIIKYLFFILIIQSCAENSNVNTTLVNSDHTKKDTPIIKNTSELTPYQKKTQEILANATPNTSYTPYQATKRTNDGTISKEIEQQLIEQGEEMFNYLQNYDLEALDMFAPRIEEMAEYYKVFNTNAFLIKWGFFERNYENDGLSFGDNLAYDQDLIRRITARAAVLRAKSLSLTKERVQIADQVELNKVYIKPSKRHNDMYDIHMRFKKKDIAEYYEVVNEACWLTDRTCIYTQSWKFIGKYIPYTDKYIDSELNRREGASFPNQ